MRICAPSPRENFQCLDGDADIIARSASRTFLASVVQCKKRPSIGKAVFQFRRSLTMGSRNVIWTLFTESAARQLLIVTLRA